MQEILTTPALRRKALYLVAGLVGLVGMVFGKFTAAEAETWSMTLLGHYDQIAPVINAIVLAVAFRKATPAADDPTTVEDVEAAKAEGRREGAADALQDVRNLAEKAGSALATYRGPTSRG